VLNATTVKQRFSAPRTSTYSKLAEESRPDIVLAGTYEWCTDETLTTPELALVAPVTTFSVQVTPNVPLAVGDRRILYPSASVTALQWSTTSPEPCPAPAVTVPTAWGRMRVTVGDVVAAVVAALALVAALAVGAVVAAPVVGAVVGLPGDVTGVEAIVTGTTDAAELTPPPVEHAPSMATAHIARLSTDTFASMFSSVAQRGVPRRPAEKVVGEKRSLCRRAGDRNLPSQGVYS
jgi:hypothetical protein